MIDAVPLTIALVAGALATINPCGFPLLPAFLSYYVGVQDERLPRAPNRVAQGLVAGGLMTVGFLGVFSVVGLPVAYGAGLVSDAVPWAGLAIGVALFVVGLLALLGRGVKLSLRNPVATASGSRSRTLVLFGIGYGIASLGCTLPLFLALIGAAVGAGNTLSVFAAYGAGMAVMLLTFAVAAALVREGIARALRRVLPHMTRIGGALLSVAGAYLAYYWGRIQFGSTATLADDPVVGGVSRFTARIEVVAADGGTLIVAIAVAVVALAGLVAAWQWRRGRTTLPLALLALTLVGCGGSDEAAPTPAGAPSALVDLRSLDDLEQRFAADKGATRLVLLLSPT